MADKKISQLTAKGSKIASTDRVPIAQDNGGGTFATKYVTGAEINEVLLDTSPQLGGDLDVNGNKITSASNGNIKIEPNGTGAVLIGGNDTQPSELRFMELLSNGSSYVGFKAPADIITSRIYTLPTADGTSGQVLSTNGTGTLSWATAGGGITVGTTAVTSGTDGRVFFQAGGVVQQDAAFFWDNTNKRLGIGATPSTSVRLDVRAQGALSTDIAFRVRNSADTFNLLSIDGVGLISGRTDGAGGFNMNYQGTANTTVQLGFQNTNPYLRVANSNAGGNAFNVYTSSDNREYLAGLIGKATLAIGANPFGGTIKPNEANTNTLYMFNGTAPTLSATNSFNLYSADITAGNAAPHFRTENGAIVKVYQETTGVGASTLVGGGGTTLTDTDTFDGYTLKQIVKALRNQGLLA